MTRRRAGVWIRRVTGVLLVAILGSLAVIGAHRYRILKPQLLRMLPEALTGGPGAGANGTAVGVYHGFEHTESLAGKPVFELRASETLGLVSGWYSLEGVTLKLFRKGGGTAVLRCDRARFNAKTRAAELDGSVHLELDDGSFVDTSTGRFDPRRRIFRSTSEVFFGDHSLIGRAGSLRYDLGRDRIELGNGVRVFGADGATMQTDRVVYDRRALTVTVPGRCVLTDPGGSIDAGRGTITLSERDGRPERIDLVDGVRFVWADPRGPGEGRGTAERLLLSREGAGTWRGRARTRGPWVELEFVEGPDFLYRRIRTWELEFVVGPDGPRSARTKGMTCLTDLPADADVRFAESRDGMFRFDGNGLSDMELSREVRLFAGPFRATADLARFVASVRTVVLQSGHASDASRVHVVRDGTEVWAKEIQMKEEGRVMTARGDVQGRTTRVGFAGGLEEESGTAEEGIRFAAQTLEASSAGGRVTLRRDARVWQGPRLLLAEEIEFDEEHRTLDAVGNVRMTMPLPVEADDGDDPGAGGGGEALIVARLLHYSEREGKAVFKGGVRLSDPEHMLSAAKLTATIGETGELEGFVAEGQVVIEETAVRRRMTGDTARYTRKTGELVVTGNPARLVDEKGNVVTSRSLTWHRPDDTVTVAGEEEAPTETIYHPEG